MKAQGGQGSLADGAADREHRKGGVRPLHGQTTLRPDSGWTSEPLTPKLEKNVPQARDDKAAHSSFVCWGQGTGQSWLSSCGTQASFLTCEVGRLTLASRTTFKALWAERGGHSPPPAWFSWRFTSTTPYGSKRNNTGLHVTGSKASSLLISH